MEFHIREMDPLEYPMLSGFLYDAIFQRDGQALLPESIIERPELKMYIEDFGSKKDDFCYCAEVDGQVVGAVWVRNIQGYGSIDKTTPEFAVSVLKAFRGYGIGTEMMKKMLGHLKMLGYPKASLAVQKDNYALNMYLKVGFNIIGENGEEYIMACLLQTTEDKSKH